MRKILLLALVFVTSITAFGQDFSNKGKDFWLCFASHCPNNNNLAAMPRLSIFITSDQASTGTITMPNGAYSASFNLNAGNNYYQEIVVNPISLPANIYIASIESNTVINKSIHVKTDPGQPAVVVYTEEWAGARTAATLVLPVSVLGKKYYAVSGPQASPSGNASYNGINFTSRSHFQIIATQPNTNVQITPRFNGVKQTPFTIVLPNTGDLYQYEPANSSIDITGTYIESLAGGSSGCLPIAVFSGTSGINLGAGACTSVGSSDPLFQQLYPASSWGKNFGFIPFVNYVLGSPYRIIASEDNTNVYFDGTLVTTLAFAGDIYPNTYTVNVASRTAPTNITADKPICVAQFLQSNGCANTNGSQGDPDMVILNPIEQNINDITVFSSSEQSISQRFINVLIKTAGTASFRINNGLPATSWLTSANLPGYSYLRGEPFPSTGSYHLFSDSGFNAIAYGYGPNESYAYSAGTNVRDLTQAVELESPYGNDPSSNSICTNSPFKFKIYFPDSTLASPADSIRFDSLRWDFHDAATIVPNNFPIIQIHPTIDSTRFKNGRQVNWYSLPGLYFINTSGFDTLFVTTYRSTSEGCGNEQVYPFPIRVFDPPVADFTWTPGGCVADSFHFNETTAQLPKPTYRWWWNFGDPGSGGNNDTSNLRNPAHLFSAPGTYTVRYGAITTPGCLSDTISKQVIVPAIPNATISGNTTPVCINSAPPVDVTFTAVDGTPPFTFTYTIDAGSGPGAPQTVNSVGTNYSVTIQHQTNVAGNFIYQLTQVKNVGSTVCVRPIVNQSVTVHITPDATVTLRAGDNDNQTVCINNPIVNIRYDIGGSGNGGTVTGLPAGVTGTYAAGVITITGTPTTAVGSPFIYTINPTGPCAFPIPAITGTITVNNDATIVLTSAAGTNNQTKCINTPIADIDYLVAGGGTGATIAWTPGVPPGISFTALGGGTFRISGSPTSNAGSPYSYTISTTGPCIKPTATGTLTVTPDATVTLRAGDNNNQTVCVNNPIINIRYDIGGSGNGGTVSGLPAGVNGTYAAGVITITGTPTTAIGSPFIYTINPTGPCAFPIPAVTGTITVNDDATIALTSAAGTNNQTKCINNAITDIDYLVAGGGTGATIAWTPGVPPGINFTPLGGGNFRISGTPTATGTFNYTISTTGPCIKPTATGSIIVNPDHTIAFNAGTPNPTLCVNTVMPSFTLVLGGGATNIAAPVNLPPGVTATVAGNIVTISGTPTLQGTYTYSITTTGNTCLTATYTNTIIVTANATLVRTSAAGTDAQELCKNSTITAITYDFGGSATGATVSGLPAGVTWSVTGNTVTIVGTPTVSSPVVYTYTVNTIGPCVTPSVTGTILVNALPTAAFTYTAPSCETRDIIFTDGSTPNVGALDQWDWIFGDPASGPLNTSNLQNPAHVYATPGGYTVTLSVRNNKGCISNPISSTVVNINNRPKAGFIVPDVCINDVATVFTDTSKIASGTINRPLNQWNYGDPGSGPLNNSVGINGSHLYPAPGNYMVRQIVTSSLGCKDTITLPITINSADPVSNFTAANSCSSDSVDLVNLSTVGFGNVTRLEIYWDNVGAPAVFQTIIAPAFNGVYRHKYPTLQVTRTYNIRMIAYSGVICSSQKITPVTVYATPKVQFNNIPNSCLLVAPFQITQGSEIGGVPGTGTYSGPGITNPNGTFNPQIAGIGTHNIKYTWTASNPGGCIDTLTKTITVLDTAHARFSVVLPSCEQVATSFTDLSTAPASVVLANTVWNFGDATPPENHAPGSTFGHTFPGPGTFTVTMHNVSAAGCLSTDTSMQVTIDANHGIALTTANSTQTLCVNVAIADIKYQLSGGATNIQPAVGLPPGVTAAVLGNVVIIGGIPTLAGTYPYSIQTTGNTCQVANATGIITVNPDHTITRSLTNGDSAQSVCVNAAIDPIVYNLGGGATSASALGLPPGVTGVPTAGNTFTISGTPTSTAGSPYNFTIQTSGNACVKANTIGEIKVNPYPVPDFAFDKTSYCIPNASVLFINNTSPGVPADYTYNWAFGDGGISTGLGPTHLYTSAGPFTVTLKARSTVVLNGGVIGCESIKTKLLDIIHPQPKADFVFSKPSVCIGDNVIITDATDGKDGIVNQWHWDLGDGTTSITNPVSHTFADTTTYTVTMHSVNTPHGCNSDTVSKTFTVYPYPHVNAGLDKNVLEGGSVQLDASVYGIEPQYSWTPVQYLTDSKILRPRVVNPATDMTYLLTVTGKGGCQFSDAVFVKLLKFPVIPNTFSPNGDNRNDEWRIDFLNTYPNNRVQIFTRSGKLVFESKGYDKPWDGTLKGKPLPFDTYYYIIEPGNGRDPITGYVTILK